MGLVTDYTVGIPYTTAMDGYLDGVYKASASLTFIFMCSELSIDPVTSMVATYTYTMNGSVVYVSMPTYKFYPQCGSSVPTYSYTVDVVGWLYSWDVVNFKFGFYSNTCT